MPIKQLEGAKICKLTCRENATNKSNGAKSNKSFEYHGNLQSGGFLVNWSYYYEVLQANHTASEICTSTSYSNGYIL